MSVGNHLPRVERRRVQIITVDPASRRIEAVGRDAAVIQVAVFEVPDGFRWPREGEEWLIRRENVNWFLDCPFQDPDRRTRIEEINPGDTILGGGEDTTVVVDGNLQADEFAVDSISAEFGTFESAAADSFTVTENFIALPPATTPPSSPVARQVFWLQTTNMATQGVRWGFQHAGSGTYPWEFIGGPPLRGDWAAQANTASSSYTTLFGGPTLIIPRAGFYDIRFGAQVHETGAGLQQVNMGLHNGTTIVAEWAMNTSNPNETEPVEKAVRIEITAAVTLTANYKSATSADSYFSERFITASPVRIA